MTNGRVLGLIPARGGSKGVPDKNSKELGGQPLLAHTIEAALGSTRVTNTVVTSEDEDIQDIAVEYGAEVPFTRPDDLATDEAPMIPVISHALRYFVNRDEPFSTVVLLQPTSPLRTSEHIDQAVQRYRKSGADSLVSVYEDHSYRWEQSDRSAERVNYPGERKNRQDKQPEFVENGAIYIVDADQFLETDDLHTGETRLFVMPQQVSVEVDEPFDFWLAEKILTEWDHQ